MDVVQRQWTQPGSLANFGGGNKSLYSVKNNLEDILKLPPVDAPVVSLTSNFVLPADFLEGLKAEDKKSQEACHKTHQGVAWAIRASRSASFFTRASVAVRSSSRGIQIVQRPKQDNCGRRIFSRRVA